MYKHNSKNIGIMMQNATLLMFMSHQPRNNGNMSDFVTILVRGMLILSPCARAATFNDCIHMDLVPYPKSQITPSANDEMNKITLPSRHRIRNLSPGGLRPSTLALSHGGSSVPHNTYE